MNRRESLSASQRDVARTILHDQFVHILAVANNVLLHRLKFVAIDFEPSDPATLNNHRAGIFDKLKWLQQTVLLLFAFDDICAESLRLKLASTFGEIASRFGDTAKLPHEEQQEALLTAGAYARVRMIEFRLLVTETLYKEEDCDSSDEPDSAE